MMTERITSTTSRVIGLDKATLFHTVRQSAQKRFVGREELIEPYMQHYQAWWDWSHQPLVLPRPTFDLLPHSRDEDTCPTCWGQGVLETCGRKPWEPKHPEDDDNAYPCPDCNGHVRGIAALKHWDESRIPDELHNLSFESWHQLHCLTPAQEQMAEKAMKWAVNIGGALGDWGKGRRDFDFPPKHWLLLCGPNGIGKSGLAVSILRLLYDMVNEQGLYTNFRHVLEGIKQSWGSKEKTVETTILQDVSRAKILVMDDFGAEDFPQWAVKYLAAIIEDRAANRLITIFTSNLSETSLKSYVVNAVPQSDQKGAIIWERMHHRWEVISGFQQECTNLRSKLWIVPQD